MGGGKRPVAGRRAVRGGRGRREAGGGGVTRARVAEEAGEGKQDLGLFLFYFLYLLNLFSLTLLGFLLLIRWLGTFIFIVEISPCWLMLVFCSLDKYYV